MRQAAVMMIPGWCWLADRCWLMNSPCWFKHDVVVWIEASTHRRQQWKPHQQPQLISLLRQNESNSPRGTFIIKPQTNTRFM